MVFGQPVTRTQSREVVLTSTKLDVVTHSPFCEDTASMPATAAILGKVGLPAPLKEIAARPQDVIVIGAVTMGWYALLKGPRNSD
jgi:hypothetical protein